MRVASIISFAIGRVGLSGALALLAFGFTLAVHAPFGVAAEQDASGLIEEIVVTSRRRQESQQDVPLSVTAFGAEQIEQIKPQTLRDFDGFIPNMYIGMNTAGPGASALYIRGVGYADIEKTQSPQVGVIVDGIQMGSSTGQLIDTFDVESIEVNRGPQGVLFGKNTIGGNVVVNRVRPQFNELGARLSAEVGNYDSRIIKGRVNIPLIDDTLALKVGAISRERDGFYDNITLDDTAGDIDFASYTAALRWAPERQLRCHPHLRPHPRPGPDTAPGSRASTVTIPLRTWPTRRSRSSTTWTKWGFGPSGNSATATSSTRSPATTPATTRSIRTSTAPPSMARASPFAQLHTLRDQQLRCLHSGIADCPAISRTPWTSWQASTTSIRNLNSSRTPTTCCKCPFGLPPGVPCAAVIPILRDNPRLGNVLCQFPNARSIQKAGEDVQSVAVFGAINWRPVEQLELSFGARYIDEEKDGFNSYFDYSTGTFDTGPVSQEHNFAGLPERAGVAYEVSDSWDDVILLASATWAITDVNTAYVSYSEGFRSGGFSIRSARDPAEATFDPEDAFQVEVGIKNEFFDRRLRVNLAYFHLERDSSQFSSIITLPPGSIPGTTTIINNGGTSEFSGVELESQWLINEDFTLVVNGGILDVKNQEFTIDCIHPGRLQRWRRSSERTLRGTLRTLGGNSDSRQPEWNFSVTLAFARQMGPGLFAANVGWKKVGDFLLVNTGGGADQRLYEGGYYGLDARVAYEWTLNNGNIRLAFRRSART